MVEWRCYCTRRPNSDMSNMMQVTALQGNPDRTAPKDSVNSVLFHLFYRAGRDLHIFVCIPAYVRCHYSLILWYFQHNGRMRVMDEQLPSRSILHSLTLQRWNYKDLDSIFVFTACVVNCCCVFNETTILDALLQLQSCWCGDWHQSQASL